MSEREKIYVPGEIPQPYDRRLTNRRPARRGVGRREDIRRQQNRIESMEYFELKSDKLIVTDPCYNRGTWCQGIVENCLPGKWFCFTETGDHNARVAELRVVHEKYARSPRIIETIAPFEVGVDSGQAGVFDESLYPVGECGDYGDESTFYGRACAATENGFGGVIEEGFVTTSGYGDGGYKALIGTPNFGDDAGKCVSIRVVFIEEEDDDE